MRFVPRWDGAIQGHAVNQIRSFYPRLAAEFEFDDLMQEAYYVFARCRRRYCGEDFRPTRAYPARVDRPQWFMKLFSRALRNHLIRLLERSKMTFASSSMDADEELRAHVESRPGDAVEPSEVVVLLDLLGKLPGEIAELIRVAIISDDDVAARTAADKILALPAWARERVRQMLVDPAGQRRSRRGLLGVAIFE